MENLVLQQCGRLVVRRGGPRSGTARDRVAASQHKSVLEIEVFEVFKPPKNSKRSLSERRRYALHEGLGPLTDSLGKFCRSASLPAVVLSLGSMCERPCCAAPLGLPRYSLHVLIDLRSALV